MAVVGDVVIDNALPFIPTPNLTVLNLARNNIVSLLNNPFVSGPAGTLIPSSPLLRCSPWAKSRVCVYVCMCACVCGNREGYPHCAQPLLPIQYTL